MGEILEKIKDKNPTWSATVVRGTLQIIIDNYAKKRQKIYYSEWNEICKLLNITNQNKTPHGYGRPAGLIGDFLLELGTEKSIIIPPLQSIIINKRAGIPSSGFDSYRKKYKKTIKKNEITIEGIQNDVFNFNNWHLVKKVLESKKVEKSLSRKLEKIKDKYKSLREKDINIKEKKYLEGQAKEHTQISKIRNGTLVKEVKKRDKFRCKACNFHFSNKIVEAHHLNPLATSKEIRESTLKDLITLCPTCHKIAHYLFREGNTEKLKGKKYLRNKIREIVIK